MTNSHTDAANAKLSAKLSRQIATISSWPEIESDNILEDRPEKALALVLTLKHFANPLGGYPVDADIANELKNVTNCITDPSKLEALATEKLNTEEKTYLTGLLRTKLDQIANKYMAAQNIKPEAIQQAVLNNMQKPKPAKPTNTVKVTASTSTPSKTDPNHPAQIWWDNLSPKERKAIEKRYQYELSKEQKIHLQHRTHDFYHHRRYRIITPCYYHQMCFIDSELNYLMFRSTLDLTILSLEFLARGAYGFGRLGYGLGGNLGGGGGPSLNFDVGDGKVAAIIAAIVAFVAFCTAAMTLGVYGVKKIYNSLRNIINGDKPLRSLYRLALITLGAGAGAYGGIALCAALAVFLTFLAGTAGIGIGIVGGALIGIGIGALIAKYSAKLISSIVYSNELNPTNPDKWRLSKKEKAHLIDLGIDIQQTERDILAIKQQKSRIDGCSSSFFWTDARAEKNRLNKQLKELKKGDLNRLPYPPRYQFFAPAPSAPVYLEEESSLHSAMSLA